MWRSEQNNFRPSRWSSVLVAAIIGVGIVGLAVADGATITEKGDLKVAVEGQLLPHRLPRKGAMPVSVSVSGKVGTTDESTAPELTTLVIEINRHGELDSTGLPTCKRSELNAASSGRALAACRQALVGHGKFIGTITLPGSPPYPIDGRLLVFNGVEHGHSVLFGHIYSPHPFANSFVIPFAVAKKRSGTYGTVLTANLAKALGKKRSLSSIEMTLSRRYSYRGKARSYVSAGCPAPSEVNIVSFPLARTSFQFAGGVTLTSVLERTCSVRR